MKKAFLSILFGIVTLHLTIGQQAQINGKIPEINEGNILLIVQKGSVIDTIASAPIIDNEFIIKLDIDNAIISNLIVEGFQGGTVMIVEPGANYEMLMYRDYTNFNQSGRQQEELTRYQAIVADNNAKIAELRSKIDDAERERKFKTKSELTKDLNQLLDSAQSELSEIIEQNRGTVLSTYLITNGLRMANIEELESIYSKLNDEEKKNQAGGIYEAMIAGIKKIEVNSIAPDFILPDVDGNKHSLHSIQGKLKIMDFWASWCGPCRKENPNMVALYNDFKSKGLTIVGVSLDDNRASWIRAIETDGLEWLQLSSLKGFHDNVAKSYNIEEVPTILILDSNNRIIAKNLRGKKLREFVTEYLDNSLF